MTDLLDVNVLVSLAWPNHVHHEVAQQWFRSRGQAQWATTPVTECGFVRVSSNRRAIPTAVTTGEAMRLLERILSVPHHVFLPDDVPMILGNPRQLDPTSVVTHHLVTDAHLLAVARRHGARLATFDRAVVQLATGGTDDVVALSPG